MLMQLRVLSMALCVLMVLAACSGTEINTQPENMVVMLLFEEEETGTGTYLVRMLLNDHYLRIDDAEDEGDFLLYDRSKQQAYGVDHDERRILIIDAMGGEISQPDFPIDVAMKGGVEIPAIAGIHPSRITISANGKTCFEAVVVPGLMESAVTVLIEYQAMLSRRQQAVLGTMPAEMITPCFLTRYLHGSALHLKSGFPAREWDEEGYLRVLVDFDESYQAPADIFNLPEGYTELDLSH